jgi:ornithine carbamoyltransferase
MSTSLKLSEAIRPSLRGLIQPKYSLTKSNLLHHATSSPKEVRHLLSIADVSSQELTTLVRKAASHKSSLKAGSTPKDLLDTLKGQTIAMTFSKRSTRTRVSTEAAVTAMGGHPMFLGKDDIQLGVS